MTDRIVQWTAERRQGGRVVRPPALSKRQRERVAALRCDLQGWLLYFLDHAFNLEFSPDHIRVLALLQEAVLTGGLFAQAMPRGSGKTTMVKGTVLFSVLNGHRRYVVPVGADARRGKEILDYCKTELRFNDKLFKHYPAICSFIRDIEGKGIKAYSQLREDGEPSRVFWGAEKLVLPDVDHPAAGAVIESRGLTGNIRGMSHETPEGGIIRPDFVILDDPQTRESAMSPTQCDDREAIIRGDVLGMAGPTTRITAVMPCTVIRRGDLADRFLDREQNPEWQGERTKLVNVWPDAQETLWAQYRELYEDGKRSGDGTEAATAFYIANRDAMDAGSDVSWEARKFPDEISALQHAENLLIERKSEAFSAEYQNEPEYGQGSVYTLTDEIVLSRIGTHERWHAPAEAFHVSVMIDCNYSGLHWCASALRNDMTGYCIGWGKYPQGSEVLFDPKHPKGKTDEQVIYEGVLVLLARLADQQWWLGGQQVRPGCVMVDCGQWMDAVFRAVQRGRETLPFRYLVCSRGRSAQYYRQTRPVGRPGDNWHLTEFEGKGRVIVHNSDVWRVRAQKALLLEPGAPGAYCLYAAPQKDHRYFAEHVCAEQLVEYIPGDAREYYTWKRVPGAANDLLDALVGSLVGAAACGAGASVIQAPRKRRVVTGGVSL